VGGTTDAIYFPIVHACMLMSKPPPTHWYIMLIHTILWPTNLCDHH